MKPPEWTSEERLFLINNYADFSNPELAEQMGRTTQAIKSKGLELKLQKSEETKSRISCQPNAGQFKKGNLPLNTLTDQVISIRVDQSARAMKYIRINKGYWMELKDYNWRQAGFGKPPGTCLIFKDGDSLNCAVENLELITKAENLRRNYPINHPSKTRSEKIVASRQSPAAKSAIKKERVLKIKAAITEKRKALRVDGIRPAGKEKLLEEKALHVQERKALVALQKALAQEEKKLQKQQKQEAEKQRLEQDRRSEAAARKQAQGIAKARRDRKIQEWEEEQRQKLPSRQINTEELVPVRLDHQTVIYIKPGRDPEAVRQKFLNRSNAF